MLPGSHSLTAIAHLPQQATAAVVAAASSGAAATTCSKSLVPMGSRWEMGEFLEKEGFTTGAELGVQRGDFSKQTLDTWPSCKKYILVDAWKHQVRSSRGCQRQGVQSAVIEMLHRTIPPPPHPSPTQENYKDSANVEQAAQDDIYGIAQRTLEAHKAKTEFMRMFTSEAVKKVEDASLDYV